MGLILNEKRAVIWLGVASFAWSMMFVWQGLDFTDMGFWLTGYQQFYSHPETFWGVCWLSSFIGHWMGLVLGGDVLAYRLGYVLVTTASAITAYQLLASQLGRSYQLVVMVLLVVFFTRSFGGNWVGYNDLTALFYLAAATLLFFGLVSNRKLLVMLAGMVLGANVFVRLPNLLGILLVATIWLQAWVYGWSLRHSITWSTWFLGGFSLGVALIWGLIVLHGHQAIYIESVLSIFGEVVDTNAVHTGPGLLNQLIKDHIKAFYQASTIVIIGSLLSIWADRQKIFLASLVILVSALLLAYVFYVFGDWSWCIPGFCYIQLISIVLLKLRTQTPLALLAFIAGLILFLTPIGSTNGITNSIFGIWLALPLALMWLWQSSEWIFCLQIKKSAGGIGHHANLLMTTNAFRGLATAIMLAALFHSLTSAWRHTYLDSKNRFTMTYSIAHPLLAGTYTTAERAKVVTELLDAISHYAKPGDYVLAYNGIPGLYFLTETHPWLGISWPDFENVEKLTTLINKKEQTNERLPCIVRAIGSTYANTWPLNALPLATFWHQEESRRVFAEFEKKHGYTVSWSNDFFEILMQKQ